MKSALKYLLLPVTIIAWFFLAYYIPYVAIIGTVKVFNLSWVALIFFGGFIFGLLYFVVVGLPDLIRLGIGMLYQKIPFVIILHGIAGVIGTFWIVTIIINQPPMMVQGDQQYFFITGMWQDAPLKTIYVLLGVIPFIFLMIYNSMILPFVLFVELQKEINEDNETVIINQDIDIEGLTKHIEEPVVDVEADTGYGLKPLEIQRTLKTPYVLFKPDGKFLMKGRCIPEDISVFMDQILDWVNDYIKLPAETTTLKLEFEYINDVSKYLLIMLKRLRDHCPDFLVIWVYEEGDDDILELGEMMCQLSGSKFHFIEMQ